MLPVATNILDQLLGGFETTPFGPTGTPGAVSETGPGGLLFGELLAQLTEGGNLAADTLKSQMIQRLFPSIDQPAAQDGAPAGLTVYQNSLIGINIVQPQITALNLPPAPNPEGDTTAKNPLPSTPLLSSPAFDLLTRPDMRGASPLTGQTEPQPGIYNIIDAHVEGGQVEITASVDGQSAQPVRISVPLTVVRQALMEKILAGALTPLSQNDMPGSVVPVKPNTPELDALLKNLNLKTIEISESVENAIPKTGATGVQLTLIAENNGVRIALTSKLNKQDIKFALTKNQQVGSNELLKNLESAPKAGLHDASVPSQQGEPEALMSVKKNAGDTTFNLAERMMLSLNLDSSDANQSTTTPRAASSFNDTPTAARNTMPAAVKLTLPDSLPKSFSAHSQTIMLRIEPDHLGPARLNLSVRDQMLTARVTVDSPAAKLAVERSLDQLTEQLLRAGIDVDRIDVMLNNNGGRENFFDRRSMWAHGRKARNMDETDKFESNIESSPVLTMRPMRQYVGVEGVNVLA